jgi:hypothetical protein
MLRAFVLHSTCRRGLGIEVQTAKALRRQLFKSWQNCKAKIVETTFHPKN